MSELTILAPIQTTIEEIENGFPLRPFAQEITDFLQTLSAELLKTPQAKIHPELVALGFWLRKTNLNNLQNHQPQGVVKALGLVLHFTPANVDTMFVYSWVCSLLMGNKNIVRVASQDSTLQNTLFGILNDLLARSEFAAIASSNLFVRYPKASKYSTELSLLADARLIWGGDDSVNAIRSLPCKPRSRDISFADRYSACLINGDKLQSLQDCEQLAKLLWRDTEPYSQQACSSPRVIFWQGDEKHTSLLFKCLNDIAGQIEFPLNQLNNHLVASQLIGTQQVKSQNIILDRICAISVEHINDNILGWHNGSGLFLVYVLSNEEELNALMDIKLQTLSYWGIEQEQLLKLSENTSIRGLDRIVPVGQALDFSAVWDGFDLLGQLSRQIDIVIN